jgi:hypothetical protein
MKSPKTIAVAVLALVSVGMSALAWKYYWKSVQLEAAAGGDDVAALRRQLAEAEKRRRELEASASARGAAREGLATNGPAERPAPGEGRGGRGRGGARGDDFQAMMDRPEMQRALALQQKAALDGRYGALFKSLNLSPEKLAAFKSLLAEKEATMMDTMRAAREQGIDPRNDPEGFKKLMATTQAEVDASIKTALGDDAYAQYQQYQATEPQRNVVSQLQKSLSYTSDPLTTAQAEQLVQVLAANSSQSTASAPPDGGGRGGFMGGPGGGGGGGATITTAAVAQAQTVLSASQLQALQDLQTLQQAQQQAQQAMRANGAALGTRGTGGE